MKKENLNNSNMHFEHTQWNGELSFWKDELKSFNNRLSELADHWTHKDILAQLEHYQNEFILHGDVIVDLQEIIEKHEISIASLTKTNTDVLSTQLSKQHIEFRNRMETQRHIYAELKKDFFRFLEKSM